MSLNFNISQSESFCNDVFHYIHKNEIKSLTRKYPHHKDLIMNEVESNNFEVIKLLYSATTIPIDRFDPSRFFLNSSFIYIFIHY